MCFGRDGVIRTLDPLHPMQVRYQAALRPESSGFGGDPVEAASIITDRGGGWNPDPACLIRR